jgi:hypothetical protein
LNELPLVSIAVLKLKTYSAGCGCKKQNSRGQLITLRFYKVVY